jgi:hypothetical protein
MATRRYELINLQDQDVVNFQNDDMFVADSDADNDDDRPRFRKVKEESLRRRKVVARRRVSTARIGVVVLCTEYEEVLVDQFATVSESLPLRTIEYLLCNRGKCATGLAVIPFQV